MSNTTSTEAQRRFIESLARTLTDEQLAEQIASTGHTGRAASVLSWGTRNQALKGITKIQASALIGQLKAL